MKSCVCVWMSAFNLFDLQLEFEWAIGASVASAALAARPPPPLTSPLTRPLVAALCATRTHSHRLSSSSLCTRSSIHALQRLCSTCPAVAATQLSWAQNTFLLDRSSCNMSAYLALVCNIACWSCVCVWVRLCVLLLWRFGSLYTAASLRLGASARSLASARPIPSNHQPFISAHSNQTTCKPQPEAIQQHHVFSGLSRTTHPTEGGR